MSMASQLAFPLDIPWTRVCVTEDMIDRVVCDDTLPPKWNSSLAVYKYVPEEEYQSYPDYKISYLKVTATITGYQAVEDEIQGDIDWDGVSTTTFDSAADLLKSYFPCTGAIVQVVVGPHGSGSDVPLDRYPFFMDFEPKKRELYEMATDTKERQSRSSETLQLTKSAGRTASQEVLDVDMGGSTSVGMQGQYAGTGGGFNVSSSSQGQWGTKSLNTQQSQTDRRSDASRELRESFSFSTQLSQMYHLLDSYHLGTNRAVFFVQPRPHVLEEPTGFVQGPRKVEGIQEFFLVVAQPKDTDDFCVSVRLDTSHLAETDVLTYETRHEPSALASAFAGIPTENDQPANPAVKALATACFLWECWDVRYRCFMTRDVDDVAYQAPAGFTITGYDNLVNQVDHGSTSVVVAPGNKNLNIHAEAQGHIAIEAGWDVCVDCPDELEKWAGTARRQVQVNLRSDEPTVKVGTQLHLLITTRGLCCCDGAEPFRKGVVGTYAVPAELGGLWRKPALQVARTSSAIRASEGVLVQQGDDATTDGACCGSCGDGGPCAGGTAGPGSETRTMTIRQANALGGFIKERMVALRQGPDADVTPKSFVETDVFARQMLQLARRSRRGRQQLDRAVGASLPKDLAKALGDQLGKKADELTARDVLGWRSRDLEARTKTTGAELARLRLGILGVPMRARPTPPEPKRPPQKRTSRGSSRKRTDGPTQSS